MFDCSILASARGKFPFRRFTPKCSTLLSRLFPLLLIAVAVASPQAPPKKNVLIINEVGLSHSVTAVMTQQILEGVHESPNLHVEFYSESLDLPSFSEALSHQDIKSWLLKKYGDYKLDVVVAVGPGAIDFLSKYSQSIFLNVPIVICGSSAQQVENPGLDSRFTGTWLSLEPGRTVELALQLLPNTRHVFVVGGSSAYDRKAQAITHVSVAPLTSKVDFVYLTDLNMNIVLQRLRELPEHSIVLFVSFFEDAAGQKFVNATKALPMIAEAARAPVFGTSDTYLGHGIVGGSVMNLREQGKITAHIVSELLVGKRTQDFPIASIPSAYMFDWNMLKRWQISERQLPAGSIVLFREPSLWERTKWIWILGLFVTASLAALAMYLHYSWEQLRISEEKERQLGGMLITAQEKERSRLASELHDDFSQRLAVLALGLATTGEALPDSSQAAKQQLSDLANSASELGADLHTLSHRLHSSTLESLGLVPGARALCREFSAQQGIKIDFTAEYIPRAVDHDVALCLFRVIQEGLRNIQKHSGALSCRVDLRGVNNKLHVAVRDEGVGFEPKEIRGKEGLGILSMEERVHLLGGHFEVLSARGKGTTVKAWVPLAPIRDS